MAGIRHPVTPDERYFVVKESFGASAIPVSKRGRLLRLSWKRAML
jgi:hypothetical protein